MMVMTTTMVNDDDDDDDDHAESEFLTWVINLLTTITLIINTQMLSLTLHQ